MFKRTCILVLVALFCSTVANSRITTSSIEGQVVCDNGEKVVGAAIIAVHVPSGSQYYAVSNAAGRYNIDGMRPGGPYTVAVKMMGYDDFVTEGLVLTLGESVEINPSLKESGTMLEAAVAIAGNDFESSKTGAAESFSRHFLEHTPSINRGIGDIVKFNPLVNVLTNGAILVAGSNNKYNSFLIDGANNSDIFGLTDNGLNGGMAGAQPVSLETIGELQVNVAPFDVRHSGYTGGSFNAVTKSGTNDFHASAYGFGNAEWLYGSKYEIVGGGTSAPVSSMYQYQAGATVSGPIVKDKLFFFINYERADLQSPNAYCIGAPASKIDKTVAEEMLSLLKGKAAAQGLEYSGYLPVNQKEYTTSDKATVKLDWNISRSHHLSLRWGIVNANRLNNTSNAATLRASDNNYVYKSMTNTAVAELQSRIGNSADNEFRISYVGVRDKRQPGGAPSPLIQISNVGSGNLVFGNDNSSIANGVNQDLITITDNVNWTVGNHFLTMGTDNEIYHFSNLFIQNLYGVYYFNNPDDFRDGIISGGYQYGHPDISVTGNPLWEPKFNAAQFGIYVQDNWNISRNFKLTYGLRMDVPVFFDTPAENDTFNRYAASKGLNLKTNQPVGSTPLFSPRIGFRYDIADLSSYILRGGVGLFSGKVPFVWLSNNYANTGIQMKSVAVYPPASKGLDLILDPNGQAANEAKASASSGNQTVNVADKNFRMPQTLRADLAFDLHLWGVDFTAEGIFSKNVNDVVYRQLAYEKTGQTAQEALNLPYPDTRVMYASATKGTDFKDISNVYCLSNTNKGYSYNIVLAAAKTFGFGLGAKASYTYSRALTAFDGLASIAAKNFQYNLTRTDSNDPELGVSAFNTPHQVKLALTYEKSYGRSDSWTTYIGLIYTGCSGMGYSYYYNGDLNGDSSKYNDLIFIPTDSQIDGMTFLATETISAEEQKANLKAWLATADYVRDHRGEYFERYAANLPFEHHFDLHFGQKFSFNAGKTRQSIELTFDLLNFSNIFNPSWGRTYASYYKTVTAFCPITYTTDKETGQNGFQFLQKAGYSPLSCDDSLSRWRGQIGLRYSF